jgi:hypothetical protein
MQCNAGRISGVQRCNAATKAWLPCPDPHQETALMESFLPIDRGRATEQLRQEGTFSGGACGQVVGHPPGTVAKWPSRSGRDVTADRPSTCSSERDGHCPSPAWPTRPSRASATAPEKVPQEGTFSGECSGASSPTAWHRGEVANSPPAASQLQTGQPVAVPPQFATGPRQRGELAHPGLRHPRESPQEGTPDHHPDQTWTISAAAGPGTPWTSRVAPVRGRWSESHAGSLCLIGA